MESLYVLQLEGGKYYVGKTTNVPIRYKQHKEGHGSVWTSMYRPLKIVEVRRLKDEYDENNTTKQYMKKYGVDNVRGGAYCQIDISNNTKLHLEQELNSNLNKCYRCGETGHYAKECDVVWECEFCPREFTSRELCLSHENMCQGQLGCCYRCARQGHYTHDCYAKTYANGGYIYDVRYPISIENGNY